MKLLREAWKSLPYGRRLALVRTALDLVSREKKKKRITRPDFAKQIGVNHHTLNQVENCVIKPGSEFRKTVQAALKSRL